MRMLYVLLILLSTSLAHAQRVSDLLKNNTYATSLTSHDSVHRGSQNSLVEANATRMAGLQDLFGAEAAPFENNGLSWPPRPRYWWQEGYSTYLEGKVGIGLPPGGPVVSLNRTYSYKYEVSTTLHVIGTLKFLNRDSENALNELLPTDFEKVFTRDYVTMQEFFNVSEKNVMVGMCQFEIALYHGVSTSGGVSFVLSAIADASRVNYARMSVYSRMFNIKKQGPNDEYSSSWYLNHECSDRFKKYVKPFVEDSLAFKAQQYNAEFHPYNTCALTRPVAGQTDRDCKAWHAGEGFWNGKKPDSTVGRCEAQSNGESHCILKSKEGQKCPLYYSDGLDTFLVNLESMRSNTRPAARPTTTIDQGPHTLATIGYREFPCDAGLTCTMDNYRKGTATCKKINQRGDR
ncbi:MAG: hypothetical protein IT287_08790 [Bdellovibrionaceae bacterium]|nr:hypothetical protein [Pseudobdellovibrionaceae bacterium]